MDHELLMRNTRKITELENRQRVNISNVSNEAKVLKNEGTTVKAVRGAVVCNSVIKAPNIPEDLAEQLTNGIRRNEFEEAMDGKADKDHTHTEFGDLTITGKINSCRLNTNSYTSLGTVPVIPVIKSDGVMEVGRIIDFHNQGQESTDKTVRMRLYGTELRMVEGATFTAANIDINNETRLKTVEEAVATKADNGHTHADLETAIASKADNGHTHVDLETAIANKADNGHTHTLSEITDYVPPEGYVNETDIVTTNTYKKVSIGYYRLYGMMYGAALESGTSTILDITGTVFKIRHFDKSEFDPAVMACVYKTPNILIPISHTIISGKEFYTIESYCDQYEMTLSFDVAGVEVNDGDDYPDVGLYIRQNGENYKIAYFTFTDRYPVPTKSKIPTTDYLVELFYPVGSIYVSMNPASPALRFGGTWEQITDRFLYCANSSKETGGSKTITVEQLPPHAHAYAVASHRDGNPDGAADTAEHRYNYWRHNEGLNFNTITSYTGNGEDYMPPYMTVYAWYRTA